MKIQQLTKAEEQVMQYLWDLEKAFLKDILEKFPEPKPHTNTVSTILKVLKEKDFVDYKVFGRQHEYFALISKDKYSGKSIKSLVKNYFEGSYKNAVSFLVEKNEMSVEDLEMLLNELKEPSGKSQEPSKKSQDSSSKQ
ncbi:BlaI/MecI/CopY family transcriptional regulator [Chryseobacterium suipulveris]|uniref:BlaI/MecI/CopY family transcriptional regulator n=1 Tax=Chryseobacterium suipulveris TaxID=2929800 RepID=A0ABY4BT54_9FLAO|nr:BlaI/MecI/CopY family transcriptional regulator [Chryseobacterium suipulveris]UOE39760.1 BlaI/MecI/CopY family transcriptional regulator [Chryseobacterium suipulveris]